MQHISTCGAQRFTVLGRDPWFQTFWYVHQFVRGPQEAVYTVDDVSAVFLPLCVPIRARGAYSSDARCFEMTPSGSDATLATRCLAPQGDEPLLEFAWGGAVSVLRRIGSVV